MTLESTGGGWTIGDIDTHDVLCRQLSQASGCAVVSADYRLGPEHRFLATVDDCVAAVRWVRAHAAEPSLAGLPPACVLTAGYYPLRGEGRQCTDALSASGTSAQYVCFERQIHGFITMGRVIDEANTAVALCGAVWRRAFTT